MNPRPTILPALLPLLACKGDPSPATETEGTSSSSSSSTGSSSGTATEESTGSSESSTTGPMPCVSNEDCPDAAAPLCEPLSGECVACDGAPDPDGACAGLDPDYPLCVDGSCVQCTAAAPDACTGMTPVCDDATNTCVPCDAHDQCGDAACNLFTGACLPADAVVHVGAGQQYTELGAALSGEAGTELTLIVHGAMPDYNEAVVVGGGRVVAFLAAQDVATPPRWLLGAGGTSQLTVLADATVLLEGLQLTANTSSSDPGVRVNGGRAWVDKSRIVQNTGGGIVAEGGSELVLRNCFVGDGTNGVNSITIDGASANILYTSLGSGFNNFVDVFPLRCIAPVDVSVRNSVLVSFDNAVGEISCPAANVTNTASETLIPGSGNVSLGDVAADWFVDISTGNFHLDNPPAMLANTARWNTGDPPTDIDGDPRPSVDGTPDYAGADLVP
jgi:hypothetical protein